VWSGKENPLALTALYPVATSVGPVLGEYEELGLVGHTAALFTPAVILPTCRQRKVKATLYIIRLRKYMANPAGLDPLSHWDIAQNLQAQMTR
jgi:hypothetical protein